MHKQKQELRKEIIQKRNALSQEQCEIAEEYITAAFWEITSQKAAVLHTYIPINNEASTLKIISQAIKLGWKVIVPKALPNRQLKHLVLENIEDLVEGKFGTLIPKEEIEYEGEIDYVLVPGVAFSQINERMGYGGGYYDTFLSKYPDSQKIGVGYGFQMYHKLPVEEHDIDMDHLIIASV